jgi:hypothetical protein
MEKLGVGRARDAEDIEYNRKKWRKTAGLQPKLWEAARVLFKECGIPSRAHPGRFRAFYANRVHRRAPHVAMHLSDEEWQTLLDALSKHDVITRMNGREGEPLARFERNPDSLAPWGGRRTKTPANVQTNRPAPLPAPDSRSGRPRLIGFGRCPQRRDEVMYAIHALGSRREYEVGDQLQSEGFRGEVIADRLKDDCGWPRASWASFAAVLGATQRRCPHLILRVRYNGGVEENEPWCYYLTDTGIAHVESLKNP